jgi:hypothetical protein
MSLQLANENRKIYNDKENVSSTKIIFYIGDEQSEETILSFPDKHNIIQDTKILTSRNNISSNIQQNIQQNIQPKGIITSHIENNQCGNIIGLVMYVMRLVF